MSRWKRVIFVVGGGVGAVAILGVAFGRAPAFEALAGSAPRLTAGTTEVDGRLIQPYRASYALATRALGIRLSGSAMDVEVSETSEGLEVTYDYAPDDPEIADRMLLHRGTLAPVRRAFPGQSITFRGADMEVEVTRQDGSVDTVAFDYGGEVFEVSVLDLVAVATGLEEGDAFFIGWNNFGNDDEWLAEVRVRGEESVAGRDGESFATHIVDVRFPSGELRRFWLASRPPYKIRQRRFERGRLVQSGWDLVSYEASSP